MAFNFMDMLIGFMEFLWASFLLLAPMLLLGLFLSGLIHISISRRAILKWLRDDNLKSVSASAAIGVPIPLCSCSVVPVVAEMQKKGASRSSCLSFLITAPETGADSILITHAFFGFVAALVRPVISFITAVIAGLFCIGLAKDDRGEARARAHCCDRDCDAHEPLLPGNDDCYISPAQLKASLLAYLRRIGDKISRRENASRADADELDFAKICKHVFRYGFVEVADDILFALIVGVALGGVLYLALPSDLMANEYARWLAYPVMVLVGMPLYICASASTPIAAALVAKGFSPGAALIFLMTGPATNTGTIAVIVSQFGTRFASVYVAAVIAVTEVLGIALDAILIAFGATLSVDLAASHSSAIQVVQWGGAAALIALIVWRFRAGGLKSGYRDMIAKLRPCGDRSY